MEACYPSTNNLGTTIFSALLTDGNYALYKSTGGQLTPYILSSNTPYSVFATAYFELFSPSINDHGTVAFWASLDNAGGVGLFTGPDPVNDAIIRSGDSLFGSTVVNVKIAPDGFNNSGQAAFAYLLADGRLGYALATPAIPEPAPCLFWLRECCFSRADGLNVARSSSKPRGDPLFPGK
jgi:hypothetical protein